MPARLQQMIEQVVQGRGWQMLELVLQLDPVHPLLYSNPYTMPTAIA